MTKYRIFCDKCGKEVQEYIHIDPMACGYKGENKLPVPSLDICPECWKEFLNGRVGRTED